MATAPASKNLASSSCSPLPGKQTNSRNSEVANPMRRSFSGNPFAKPSIIANQRPGFNPITPANSPSDYGRRNSIGRENIIASSLRDPEDKENYKDQSIKQAKVRSPGASKCSKNFMSPTISATSKINASPRKKILTERNDSIRSSVSFSDGKSPFKEDLDKKSEKGSNQKKEVSFDPTVVYLEDKEDLSSNEDFDPVLCSSINNEVDSLSESVDVMGNDCVNLDPSFSISPRTSCSLPISDLAPLDADPSMPPYDPKTNYLSPRPQFLHYRPNPRIEQYLNGERDGKQLDEIFASETSSDAEFTEEETQSDDSLRGSSSSGVMVKGEEEDAEVEEEVVVEEEEELIVSEPSPINTSEVAVSAKVYKPNFFTKTKFTALLFVLSIACLWASVSNSPVMEPSVLNNLNFSNPYVPPEISKFIRDNLESLAQKFRQWLYESLSYIHNLTISFGEWHKPVGRQLQFSNLSTLLEDGLVDNNLLLVAHSTFKHGRNEIGPRNKAEVDIKSLEEQQLIESDENIEEVVDVRSVEKEEDQPLEADETEEVVEEDTSEGDENLQEVMGDNKYQGFEDQEVNEAHDNFQVSVTEFEEVQVTPKAEVSEPQNIATVVIQEMAETAGYISHVQSNADVIDQPVTEAEPTEFQPEVFDSRHSVAHTDMVSTEIESPADTDTISVENEYTLAANKPESFDSDSAARSSQSTEPVDLTLNGEKNIFSANTVMGISVLVLSLLSAAVFFHMKSKALATPKSATTTAADQSPVAKKLDQSPLTGHTIPTNNSRNWQTDVETMGESCPSEMSSFQYSSSSYYSKQGQKAHSEAQSQERKPTRSNNRRESMASSDCSYGSFTTYQKLTNKHGNGEEVTPVRRSSRIRNHVTSP